MQINFYTYLFDLTVMYFELFYLFVVCTQIYCCASSEPCCLRSTSQEVCATRHDAHCPDCTLHSKLFSLDKAEKCISPTCVSSADSKIPKRAEGTQLPLWPGDKTFNKGETNV